MFVVVAVAAELEEVKSVIESHPRKYSVQTTRSWEFVGLEEGEEHNSSNFDMERELPFRAGYGKSVIVGMLDSGKKYLHLYLNSLYYRHIFMYIAFLVSTLSFHVMHSCLYLLL